MHEFPLLPSPGAGDGRLDDAQWQRATNEGWPEVAMPALAPPAGAAAPIAALALPSNVVDLALWRSGLANRAGFASRT